ncbi:MAG: type 4a pilus biogenesis protein PilO [Gammaproteobacteria bacterium]|nr:type 4a pilus biogenesis protein PilO [Gammaproteobacteria bacterium]
MSRSPLKLPITGRGQPLRLWPVKIQRWFKRLGREGLLGLGLIALSMGLYGFVVQPLQQQQAELQSEILALQNKLNHSAAAQANAAVSPSEQLAAFYKFFPAAASAPGWLDKIYNAARAQGLVLEQGEYHPTPERAGRLLRYQVSLPVKGTYLQIRKFLGTVLAAIPTASLDHVGFERQKIGETLIEANIKFSLYLDQRV